jgi:hypothetical protein
MDSQSSSDPIMCAAGCGFFGNPSNENMCSKCFKDKQAEQATENTSGTIISPMQSSPVGPTRLSFGNVSLSSPLTSPTNDHSNEASGDDNLREPSKETATAALQLQDQTETTNEPALVVEPAPEMTTPVTISSKEAKVAPDLSQTAAETKVESTEEETKPQKKAQKNKKRCFHSECRKKVGLTGLECKCGYIFCSMHRWPDQHNCDFDFKTHDRNNLAKLVTGGGEFSKMQKLG